METKTRTPTTFVKVDAIDAQILQYALGGSITTLCTMLSQLHQYYIISTIDCRSLLDI